MPVAFFVTLANERYKKSVLVSMFKKSIYISIGIYSILFCSTILFQSCCKCENKICTFDFNIRNIDSLNKNGSDGVDTSLAAITVSYTAFEEANNPGCAFRNVGFNSAYAFSKHCTVTNSILSDSYKLKLDKDIVFNGVTISAGTNLIKQADLKDHWIIENSNDGFGGTGQLFGTVSLDTTIASQIQFIAGTHDVTFSFSTDDGQNLSKHKNVLFKL